MKKHNDNWDNLPPDKRDKVFFQVLRDLSRSKDNARALVLAAHGFLELLVDTLVITKCKHKKAKNYNYATKLVLLNEMGVVSDESFRSLDWFRKFRNPAAHYPVFDISDKDLAMLVKDHRDPSDLYSLCSHLVCGFWNQHSDLFTTTLHAGSLEPIHVLEDRGHRLVDIEIFHRSGKSHQKKPSDVDVRFLIEPVEMRPKVRIEMLAAGGQMGKHPETITIGPDPNAKPGEPMTCKVPAGYYLVSVCTAGEPPEHEKSWIMDLSPPRQVKKVQLTAYSRQQSADPT